MRANQSVYTADVRIQQSMESKETQEIVAKLRSEMANVSASIASLIDDKLSRSDVLKVRTFSCTYRTDTVSLRMWSYHSHKACSMKTTTSITKVAGRPAKSAK